MQNATQRDDGPPLTHATYTLFNQHYMGPGFIMLVGGKVNHICIRKTNGEKV